MARCLHLGCGLVHRPGWINLDRYTLDAADLAADALLLPFPDASFESLAALQLIEHLGAVGARYALYEWARVLAPGGALQIETPDRPAALAAAVVQETAAAARPWIWGTAERGQGHPFLFAGDELAEMVAGAGFEAVAVERISSRPDRPLLRLTARRAPDSPATRFTILLRRLILTHGLLDPADAAPHQAVLEEAIARLAPLVAEPGEAGLAALFSLAARYSPRLAACVLQALPDPKRWPASDLERTRRLAADLAAEAFAARLARRWRSLPKGPGATDDAWALLEREVSLYLAARLCPGEGLDKMRDAFEAATVDLAPSDRQVDLFCRQALPVLARRLTARAIRAAARGDLQGAERDLDRALAYDPDHLWARWNRARLALRRGERLEALAHYEALLEGLPLALRPAYEAELDAVAGRAGDWSRYAVPLADPAELLEPSGTGG